MIKPINKVIQGVFTIFHLVLGLVFFSLDLLLFITCLLYTSDAADEL